jgi:hypothetical protein
MSFYRRYIVPRLTHLAMRQKPDMFVAAVKAIVGAPSGSRSIP